jgi:hypothetical protein
MISTSSSIPRLFWRRKYHAHFPREFKDMVLAFECCNARLVLPNLPLEMVWYILEYVEVR